MILEILNIVLGYIGTPSFLETVLKVLQKLREKNPGLIYGNHLAFTLIINSKVYLVCDPVMGDLLGDGMEKLYVNQSDLCYVALAEHLFVDMYLWN